MSEDCKDCDSAWEAYESKRERNKKLQVKIATQEKEIVGLGKFVEELIHTIEDAMRIKDLWLADGQDYPENKEELVALSNMHGNFKKVLDAWKKRTL